jgi:alanine-synthesizing transaminase
MFSSRLPSALEENAVTRARARLQAAGTPVIDLTETNPTQVGIPYPPDVLAALASPAALSYTPEPLGLPGAREAVSRDYARQGVAIPPERIVLTASTSEAYSTLFKLLCDAGDEVLIPQPSYPLFDLLSRLDDVRTVPYALQMYGAWSLDRASIERAFSPRTRAILVVTPNNPTGSMLDHDDTAWLLGVCAARGVALIADEVFADYAHSKRHSATAALRGADLCFSLGGLSKSAGLPQLKLGWIAVGGPDALVRAAIDRLELICDTYLSVATPVQEAAASLIEAGATIRAAIQQRIAANLDTCRALVAAQADMTMLEPDAGWCVVLRVPATESEEQRVLRLLEAHHVLVHPGYFFDFPSEAFLVLSLLPDRAVFAEGVRRVVGA